MSTSAENHQILPNNQQQQATIFPQSNSFAALPFPSTNFTPQTHINTAGYTAPISTSTNTQKLRLPKIKLDKYGGDPMKWNMCYGLFQATVQSQPISDAEKLTHLQTLTTGRAHRAIAGYSCNSAMYATALQELELCFGTPDIIVNNYINNLQQLRMPSTQHKQSFMDFSSFIRNLVETFQTLGFTNDLNSTIYEQFLANKLHYSERLQWNQHIINNSIKQPSFINFSHWLR